MTIHKKILEWQAAHPNTTWIGWGVVWLIVFRNFVLAAEKRLALRIGRSRIFARADEVIE